MSAPVPDLSQLDGSNQLLTVSQAARLLSVHITTVRRWISQEKIPAYRIGDKAVRVRLGDLADLLTPLTSTAKGNEETDVLRAHGIRLLNEGERTQAMAAIEEARRAQEVILRARRGKRLADSWELINQARDERTRQLMHESME